MQLSTTAIFKFTGLFVWACVGATLALAPFIGRDQTGDVWQWAICHALFGIAFWRISSRLEGRTPPVESVLLVALMTVSALVLAHVTGTGLGGVMLVVVTGLLPWVFNLGIGIPWLIAQGVLLTMVVSFFPGISLSRAVVFGALNFGFSAFTFALSLVARRQTRARQELRKVNSELRATQALLAESTRIAERVRISRELHDLVGHHLTALSLNLEVASHMVSGKALEHVAQAQSVARLLLTDVREVVGSMRSDDSVDLSEALRSLVEGVPEPRIHLSLPDTLDIEDPRRAQVVLRCTQEIITNTVKHARARNLWLAVDQDSDGLKITARDDGRGTDDVDEGNGLIGMSERLKQFGGQLAVKSSLGQGFSLNAWIPKEIGL